MNLKTTVKKETLTKAVVLLLALVAVPVYGAAVTKSGTGTDLTLGASWSGAVVPGTNDVATWDTGSLGAGLTLNAGTPSWQGLKLNAGAADPLAIGSGGTLTLGTAGIDMSAAAVNATISSGLTLGSGNQTWTVNTGRTLTQNTGTFGRSAGATLLLDKSTVTGTVTASPTLVNSIIPWAIIKSSGTAANGSANGYTFATVTSGNLTAYNPVSGNQLTGGYTWTAPGANTANYDVSAVNAIGGSRTANSIRYTGPAGREDIGNNTTTTFTVNSILNAGSGLYTINSGDVTGLGANAATSHGSLVIGANNELVVIAANAGITLALPIVNGSAAGALTVVGPNTVTLDRGASTFTGNLNVNGGTLSAGLGLGDPGTATSQGSALGNIGTAVARTITVNNGGTLLLNTGNTLGTGGSANTLSAITLVLNAGSTLQTGANAATGGWWNKIGAVNLNGATISVGTGANNGGFQGLALIGNVTVGGTAASTINNMASSDAAFNGIHLGQNTTANQSITFNVADATGNANADLTISAKLLNTSQNLASSGLTKTGAGTLTLSAANGYTGSTVINNGVLALTGSGSLTSTNVFVASGAKFDVSGITYTLAASRTLTGAGVITGNVATASSSSILPGALAAGTVGTLTFNNNLNLSAGGSIPFDLSTTAASGNDQIVVGGNLTLSSSATFRVNALSGSLEAADYVLCSVAGSTTMATTPTLIWDGSVPANFANYSLQLAGNNLVLHYSAASAPVIASATTTPSSPTRNQAVKVTATVTPGSGNVVSAVANVTQLGGVSALTLVQDGSLLPSLVYTNSTVVTADTTLGNKSIAVAVTDDTAPTALTGNFVISPVSVIAQFTDWDGGGVDTKWSRNQNWVNDIGPGLVGDFSVVFSGSTGTTPDMDNNYSVGGVIFNTGASSFTLGSSTGSTLTNGAFGITNTSSSTQTVNLPIALSASQNFFAGSGSLTFNGSLANGGNTLTVGGFQDTAIAGSVSGSGGLTKNGIGTLTLTASNSFTGSLLAQGGTVVLDSGKINNGTSFSSIGLTTGDNATFTVKGTSTFTNNADLNVGDVGNAVGVWNIQDSAAVQVARIYAGSANAAGSTAQGTINQTGGSVLQTDGGIGTFALGGRSTGAGTGIYNISGGSLTAVGGIRVGGSGTGSVGTFNISGSAIVNANGGFNISRNTGTIGTLNLNGGTVTTLNITSSTGANCTNNFNGSIVKPTVNTANWISTLTRCNVRNGGAIFDTAGLIVSNLQVMAHSDIAGDNAIDGGLTKNGPGTLALTAASTFTGDTVVNAGTLALTAAGSLASPKITVATNAIFDVTSVTGGSYALNAAGTLTLNVNKTGAALNQGRVNGTSITAGGTLTVLASGDALADGDTFTLFNVQPAGAFSTTNLPTPGAGANWFTTNNYRTLIYNVSPTVGNLAIARAVGLTAHFSVAELLARAAGNTNGKTIALSSLAGYTDLTSQVTLPSGAKLVANGALTNSATLVLYTPAPVEAPESLPFVINDGRGGSATGSVSLTASALIFGSQSPRLSVDGSGNVLVKFLGIPGYTYIVQHSTDLASWVDVYTNAIPGNSTNPSVDYTDTTPSGLDFYRLKWQP